MSSVENSRWWKWSTSSTPYGSRLPLMITFTPLRMPSSRKGGKGVKRSSVLRSVTTTGSASRRA